MPCINILIALKQRLRSLSYLLRNKCLLRLLISAPIIVFHIACWHIPDEIDAIPSKYVAKEIFNSEYLKQGVGKELWYYRMTVIDAAANTQALHIAEGHWLHPESIRWEIKKDMLLGFRSHSSILNAEHELSPGVDRHYRGACVVAYRIREHFDREDEFSFKKPWHKRPYMDVDWSKNLVQELKRDDEEEGIYSSIINSDSSILIEDHRHADANRLRVGKDFIDFTTRHAVPVSNAAFGGAYGTPFRGDTAPAMIDIRHFFMRKPESDFSPLYYPDQVALLNKDGEPILDKDGHLKQVDVHKRFGFFRINLNGRYSYDHFTGVLGKENGVNALIFNIWHKSRDQRGITIPIEDRDVKPIIYYTNVLHPDDLLDASMAVAHQWDQAFKSAVFYAQPGKYSKVSDVPPIFVLEQNSCNLDNVSMLLSHEHSDLRERVLEKAGVALSSISGDLEKAHKKKLDGNFSIGHELEVMAKRDLEKICSVLEHYTEHDPYPFVYQRQGDLRFNLLNLEVGNNVTSWSGYGPMLADPLTGEIISATANINLKYVDLSAARMSQQIETLKAMEPGLLAVFGTNAASGPSDDMASLIDDEALIRMRKVVDRGVAQPFGRARDSNGASLEIMPEGFSEREVSALKQTQRELIGSIGSLFEKDHKKDDLRDPIRMVDEVALGLAIKYLDLSEHDRFLKIRENIYRSLALHEIGHNVGLKHNMASSSDTLNYRPEFWQQQRLPNELQQAKLLVRDDRALKKIEECIEANNNFNAAFKKLFGMNEINTHDCLSHRNTMYSSVMDYSPSVFYNHSLGHYDLAAIKWAYGHVVEVFPVKNLHIDPESLDLSRWLKLNNYRHIPKTIVKNIQALEDREHVRVSWRNNGTCANFPSNAVPYTYCDDPSGFKDPRCMAFDSGPDRVSSAQWLRQRHRQQYLFSNFARDRNITSYSGTMSSLMVDIDILQRFTNMMRWYYRYTKEDPEFKGSYAEQDLLKAIAIGMNHFAHVLSLPKPGPHLSAPGWMMEELSPPAISADRLSAAPLMIPLNDIPYCSFKAVTSIDTRGQVVGRNGYSLAQVPLGIGRPLRSAYSQDIEDDLLIYAGSNLVKKFALHLMMSPLMSTGSLFTMEKDHAASVTWHQIFEEAVSGIYAAVMSKNYASIGLLVKEDGSISERPVIDEKRLTTVDHGQEKTLLPAMEDGLSIFAAQKAILSAIRQNDPSSSLVTSMKISCSGCQDDVEYTDTNEGISVVAFTDFLGRKYRATRISDRPSVGADLLDQANRLREYYARLEQCIKDESTRKSDSLCSCVKVVERTMYDQWVCCHEDNEDCSGPNLEMVGDGLCSLSDLEKRKRKLKESINGVVGFIDAIRKLLKDAGL